MVKSQSGTSSLGRCRRNQYFLSDEKFRARYHPERDERGVHLPAPQPLPMVRLTAGIRFRSPWGAMQYAPAGSVLVLKQNDLYAIHADSFARSYRAVGDDAEASPAVTEQLIATVRSAALQAAEMLRTQRAEAVATAKRKKDGTPVTALDYQVQRLYVEALFANPHLAGRVYLVGEESFADAKISQAIIDQNRMAFGTAEFVVVVDPLDNTRGYCSSDTSNYATVAAVLRRGQPIYFVAIGPESGDSYEARVDGVTWNGGGVPLFREGLAALPRLLAAGLHWVNPVDPLAAILPERFLVTDRFGSFQMAVARMVRRDPSLPSQDGVLTAGFPYHETIPAAAVLHLAGATTVRANGLGFFPIQWSDLAAVSPHQLIAGTTPLVNAVRQLRIEHPPG